MCLPQVNIVWPIIFLLGCIFLVVFPMYQEPLDTAIGLGIMASGVPVYAVFVWWKSKPRFFMRFVGEQSH